MLSFFRINDPYRLIIVLLILIIIQIPYMISGQIISFPEIEWQTIGKALASGKSMYVDIYHPTGPMASWVYWLFSAIFPDNYVVYKILAIILIIFQATIFNFILIEHRTHNQNTYIPAIVYVILMSGLTDFSTLSTPLLGITFILLAINLSFRHIEGRRKNDWVVLQIGIYYGLAALCYPLSYLLMLSTFFSFIVFTNTLIRRYVLIIIGFLVPVSLVWIKYYWFNQLDAYYLNFGYMFFPNASVSFLTWKTLFAISIIPMFFLLAALLKIFRSTAFINYQTRLQNFMLLNLLTGLVIVFLDYHRAPYILIILNPAIAFFLTHYFLLFRKRFLAELYFTAFFACFLFLQYGTSFGYLDRFEWIDFKQIYFSNIGNEQKDKKVLVLGNDSGHYYRAELATPYLSWPISKQFFENIDSYSASIKIYNSFMQDLPEFVFDQQNQMKPLLNRIPDLDNIYEERSKGVFNLKKQANNLR